VADTVGSGDSFLAALISKILSKSDYNDAIEFACAAGALVASKNGANPDISLKEIKELIETNNFFKKTKK